MKRNLDPMTSLEPASMLEPFLTPLGFTAPEMEEIEIFHEATKLKGFHEKTLGRRIGTYLVDERAVLETAGNYKLYTEGEVIQLPPPQPISKPLSDILQGRKSCRAFSGEPITLAELSQVLSAVRATRKVTLSSEEGIELWFRPYPSGGGLYPSEIYVAFRNIEGMAPGLLHYDPRRHALTRIVDTVPFSDMRTIMGDEDGLTLNAGAVFFVSTLPERTVVKYAYRGYRFAIMEAGMIPLALNLAATGIGLGALHWGGFLDDRINALIGADGISETIASCLIIGKEINEHRG